MVDLFGEYRHKVDAKGRLALPAKFRKELSDDLVVTIDPLEGLCLYVFTTEDYKVWVKSFFNSDGFNPNDLEETKLRRKLRKSAVTLNQDSAGRINIDATQRGKVAIDKDVVLIGNEGYFEIWDAKRWEDYCDENY